MKQRDAKFYLDRLNDPILTPEQRLQNFSVLVDVCRDFVNKRVTYDIVQQMFATVESLDEQAHARGVPDRFTPAFACSDVWADLKLLENRFCPLRGSAG